MSDTEFCPTILALACHYCAYAAADLAGSMRLQYPASVRVLRLPCTGKVEPEYVLRAFENGADGVIVAGCLEGGCHYQEGNLRARRRVERVQELMREIGLKTERLQMFNLSSAQGTRFAEIVTEMHERIQKLGPSPIRIARANKAAAAEQPVSSADQSTASAEPRSASEEESVPSTKRRTTPVQGGSR